MSSPHNARAPYRLFVACWAVAKKVRDIVRTAIDDRRRIANLKKQLRILQEIDRLQQAIDACEMQEKPQEENWSLAAMEQGLRDAQDGRPLSEAQTATVKELHEQYHTALKAYNDRMAILDDRQARIAAEEELARIRERGRTSHLLSERSARLAKIAEDMDLLHAEFARKIASVRLKAQNRSKAAQISDENDRAGSASASGGP